MKNILYIFFIFLFFLFPLFHKGFYESHDGENHVARFGAYFKSVNDGQFPPRWASDLNYGYGSPLFLFFYPLPGYVSVLFHSLGFELEDSFKIIAGVSFLLGPIFFYLWAKEFLDKKSAFFSAFLYGLAPYHFLDIYVRGDIGEVLSFVFIPLVFLMIEKNIKKPKIIYILLGGLFYGLLILSHNILSLMFSPIFLVYVFIKTQDKTRLKTCFILLVLGLLASLFFWMPALLEAKYLSPQTYIKGWYENHFPTIIKLISPQWGFGSEVNSLNGLSPQLGVVPVFLFVFSFFLIKKMKDKKVILFWYGIFFMSLFMATSLSSFVWDRILFLQQFQFPWKFIALSSFSLSVIGGLVFNKVPRWGQIMIFVAVLFFALPLTGVKNFIDRKDLYYLSFPGSTYYHGEATTRWSAGDPHEISKSSIELIQGRGVFSGIKKTSTAHMFSIESEENIGVLDNTTYFPGWRVYINSVEVPIQFQDPAHRGLITFSVPAGRNHVKILFERTNIRKIADLMSLITIVVMGVVFLKRKKIDSTFLSK